MNILVIESDPNKVDETLSVFNRFKEKECVNVVVDGQEALDFIYREGKFNNVNSYDRPDLVLLGINMHRSIGFVLQDELRNRRNNIPVFLPPIIN